MASSDSDIESKGHLDDGIVRRGNIWTAGSHIITAVIGAGVLGLASSLASMGWAAGPIVLLAFGFVTYYTSSLLSNTYRASDGSRNSTYIEAVKVHLGERQMMWCAFIQYINLFGVCVGYTITASKSLLAMEKAICYGHHGHDATCGSKLSYYIAGFGALQIVFSQLKNFHKLWWLSIMAGILSFAYSAIGLGLGTKRTIDNGVIKGSLTGIPIGDGPGEYTEARKAYEVLMGLGNMAFAYSFSQVLLTVEDTVEYDEIRIMKKASKWGIAITTMFYMSVGCMNYAAFGNNAPGNLLTGFGYFNPVWLIVLGNLFIAGHLLAAFQVFAQPIYSFLEDGLKGYFPTYKFLHDEYLGRISLSPLRLTLRTLFVIVTTMLALVLPYFNSIMGLLGALGFWPLTIYFPIAMTLSRSDSGRNWKWWLLQSLNVICFCVSLGAAIGSIEGIINSEKGSKIFH